MPEVGKTYRVECEDCCVTAYFTATLLRIDAEGEDLVFDNGVTLGTYNACTFAEVPSPPPPEGPNGA